MAHYIDKDTLVAEIESKRKYAQTLGDNAINSSMQQFYDGIKQSCVDILSFLDTLEVKEMDLTNMKTDWCPSNKQINSLRDLLKYNIGVFDYQKFMEVNSLYEDLTKILDYETNRQK